MGKYYSSPEELIHGRYKYISKKWMNGKWRYFYDKLPDLKTSNDKSKIEKPIILKNKYKNIKSNNIENGKAKVDAILSNNKPHSRNKTVATNKSVSVTKKKKMTNKRVGSSKVQMPKK